jgi:hypothetical protein
MESETIDILTKLILALITVFGFSVMLFLLKKWLGTYEENIKLEIRQVKEKQEKMNGSVKDVIDRHHACREELPEKYATKDSVYKLFDEIKPIRLDIGLIKREIKKREKELLNVSKA